jgi:hypothetical protein
MFAALLVGSCAQPVWVKPGATASDFEVAKGRCLASAYSQVPSAPTVATLGGGYQSPMITNCTAYGNSANCFTTGGQYTPPISVPYDANGGVRTQVYQGCMYADGWSLQQADVGHQEPASPSPEITPAQAEVHDDWVQGRDWALKNKDAVCYEPPASVKHPAAWATGCGAVHKEPNAGPRPPEANEDWSKGLDWGSKGAACEAPPAGIQHAADWAAGCRAGRMERVLEAG